MINIIIIILSFSLSLMYNEINHNYKILAVG